MSATEAPEPIHDPLPDGLVEAGVFPTGTQAAEYGLVVLAAGHPYWVVASPGGFRLLVEAGAAAEVRHHLAAYQRESMRWPPPPIVDPWSARTAEILTPLLWSAAVLAIFHLSGTRPRWIEAGALDATGVFSRGEWWRIGTALFLHADPAHVISNALGGLLVFTAVLSTIGRARGWLLILLSSVAGNLAVAAVNYGAAYRAVGASTALFAGVGLLTGRATRVVTRSRHPHRWRSLFVPLAAGLTVLGLYGAGGLRVDVGAHLTGFVAGLVAGFLAGLARAPTTRPRSFPTTADPRLSSDG